MHLDGILEIAKWLKMHRPETDGLMRLHLQVTGTPNIWWFSLLPKQDYILGKQAHIPVRSISYRINYEQYHSKIRMIFACIWIELPAIAFFSLILGFLSTRLLIVAYMLFLLFLLKIFLDNL